MTTAIRPQRHGHNNDHNDKDNDDINNTELESSVKNVPMGTVCLLYSRRPISRQNTALASLPKHLLFANLKPFKTKQ